MTFSHSTRLPQLLLTSLLPFLLTHLYTDVFFLDCYTPVGSGQMKAMLYPRIYMLECMREFFAGQTLFLHGSIAYCIYSYIVKKVGR